MITFSNEDLRSGLYLSDSSFKLSENESPNYLINKFNTSFGEQNWSYHSLVALDQECTTSQRIMLNNRYKLPSNSNAFNSSIGYSYLSISNSEYYDKYNLKIKRGVVDSICNQNYAQFFDNILNNVGNKNREVMLKCVPIEAPKLNNSQTNQVVTYIWNNGNSIYINGSELFQKLKLVYSCNNSEKK